jgi:hypothetical protein
MFQPKITHARLVLSPFSSEQMLTLGNALSSSIIKRIKSGTNANDEPSKPLKGAKGNYVPYTRFKQNRGLQPLRDWVYSGRTLRSLKVLSVNENSGKIGFTDQRANTIAGYLNKIDKAFGIAPSDRKTLTNAFNDMIHQRSNIQFQQAA